MNTNTATQVLNERQWRFLKYKRGSAAPLLHNSQYNCSYAAPVLHESQYKIQLNYKSTAIIAVENIVKLRIYCVTCSLDYCSAACTLLKTKIVQQCSCISELRFMPYNCAEEHRSELRFTLYGNFLSYNCKRTV